VAGSPFCGVAAASAATFGSSADVVPCFILCWRQVASVRAASRAPIGVSPAGAGAVAMVVLSLPPTAAALIRSMVLSFLWSDRSAKNLLLLQSGACGPRVQREPTLLNRLVPASVRTLERCEPNTKPYLKGLTMNRFNQALCKRCGRGMDTVARIAPMGEGPGLVAFLCAQCGAATSTLIYREEEVAHEQRKEDPQQH